VTLILLILTLKKELKYFFFFSSRRRHTRFSRDWSSDVCSSDLNLNEFWRQAHGRVEHAQRMGDRMSEAIAIEEFGAYAIENYERAPMSVRKWVDDVIGFIKDWLFRRFGIQIGEVTPAQLRALAAAALRSMAEQPAPVFDRRPLGGLALNEAPLSVGETIDVDGVSRPTTNSNGQPIAATEEGIRNFWRWFGSSRVVDDQGRPLVVYHGTPEAAPTVTERFEYAERRAAEIAQEEEADAWSAVFDRINDVLQSKDAKVRVSTQRDVRNIIDLVGEDYLGRDIIEMLNSIPSWRGITDPVAYLNERREKLTEEDIRVLDRAPFAVFDDKRAGGNTGAQDAKVGFFFTHEKDFARRFTARVEKDPMTGRVSTW